MGSIMQAELNGQKFLAQLAQQVADDIAREEQKRQKSERKAARKAAEQRRIVKAQRANEARIAEANYQGRLLWNNIRIVLALVAVVVVVSEIAAIF